MNGLLKHNNKKTGSTTFLVVRTCILIVKFYVGVRYKIRFTVQY